MLTQLESQYGDKVKLVFREYPIDQLHPQARKGHKTARCGLVSKWLWATELRRHAADAMSEGCVRGGHYLLCQRPRRKSSWLRKGRALDSLPTATSGDSIGTDKLTMPLVSPSAAGRGASGS
jgi:hypothetical protein